MGMGWNISFELPNGNGRDLGFAGWENMGMGFKFQMGMGMGWNGNEVIEMGGICYEKSIPAHLYIVCPKIHCSCQSCQ